MEQTSCFILPFTFIERIALVFAVENKYSFYSQIYSYA